MRKTLILSLVALIFITILGAYLIIANTSSFKSYQTLGNLEIKISEFHKIDSGYQVYINVSNNGPITEYLGLRLEDSSGNRYSEDNDARFYLNHIGLFRNFIEPSSSNEGYLLFPKTKSNPKYLVIMDNQNEVKIRI